MSGFPVALAGSKRRKNSLEGLSGIMYLRASQDKSGRSISVKSQYEEGLEFFEEHGIRLLMVYSDNNLSGSQYATHDGRDEYELALADLRSGRAQVLWTFDSSRAQRDLEMYLRLRRICIDARSLWAYGGRVYDMTIAKDRQDTAQDALDAERTADNISEHTTRGIKSRAKRGEHAGAIAYGYRPIYDPNTGKSEGWVIVESEKEVIRRIVDWCLARKKVTWIARTLNAEGVPCPRDRRWDKRLVARLVEERRSAREWARLLDTLDADQRDLVSTTVARVQGGETPKEIARELNRDGVPYIYPSKWDATKVKNIALSPPSAGLRRWHGDVVKQKVPDPDAPGGFRLEPVKTTWKGIKTPEEHAMLTRLLKDPGRAVGKDGNRVKHRWSGIARCGVCESPVRARPDRNHLYYCCGARSVCVARRADLLDAWLTEQAILLLEREDAAQIFRLDQDAGEANLAQREAEELRAQLDGFRGQALRKEITAESFAFFEADLLPRIERADAQARQAKLPPVLAEVIGADARRVFLGLDLADQREILRAIMRPRIYRTQRKKRGRLDTETIDPGFLFEIPTSEPAPEGEGESAAA
jgi:DNA invertase Pin-like site-specific DNA recombinase